MPPSLLELPDELLVYILCELPPTAVRACRNICQQLHNLIRDSVVIQYVLALDALEAEDNPGAILPAAAKLRSLISSETAWSTLNANSTTPVRVEYPYTGVYDLTGGWFFLTAENRRALFALDLSMMDGNSQPVEAEWKKIIRSEKYIADVRSWVYEHDLIAVTTSSPDSARPGSPLTFNIEVELLAFSTSGPHPNAQHPTLHVMKVGWEKPIIGLDIVGIHLVITVSVINPEKPPVRVFIFEWQTGMLKASFEAPNRSYMSLVFLTPELILLPNAVSHTLDVFRIPVAATFEPLSPILQLGLPSIATGRILGTITCRANPSPIDPSSYPGMRRRRESTRTTGDNNSAKEMPWNVLGRKGWLPNPDDAICLFELHILALQLVMMGGALNMQYAHTNVATLVVHRRALAGVVEEYEYEERIRVEEELEKLEAIKMQEEAENKRRADEEKRKKEEQEAEEEVRRDVAVGVTSSTTIGRSIMTSIFAGSAPNPNVGPGVNEGVPDPAITVLWRVWGPSIGRWFNDDGFSTNWITRTAGARLVRMKKPRPVDDLDDEATEEDNNEPFVVLDFSPRRLARTFNNLGTQQSADSGTDRQETQNINRSPTESLSTSGPATWSSEDHQLNYVHLKKLSGNETEPDDDDEDMDDEEDSYWRNPTPGTLWINRHRTYFRSLRRIFDERVASKLGYVGRVSRGRYAYDGIMLDDERVVGTYSDSVRTRSERMEVHHFG